MPDRVYTISSTQLTDQSPSPLTAASNNGAWYYNNATFEFTYIGIDYILFIIIFF